ncbi:hypothetical protein LTR85_007446 [Meristemomyces frigidus]|nr:hypothetical protein LTR85_007446 [Meristemomyces frigidus]
MDTSAVTDLYQRYKLGTKHVLEWVVDTARQTCDVAAIIPSLQTAVAQTLDQPTSKPRKSRKKKKAQKDEEQPAAKLTLSTQDLTRLATAIASAAAADKPAPDGIETTISVMEDVINGRSECAVWYRTQAQEDSSWVAESGKRHGHFVDVLRSVLGALKQTLWASRPKPVRGRRGAAENNPQLADEALGYAFASLHVDEPASTDEAGTEAPARKPKPTTANNKKLRCELEKTDEDAVFALWCILKECHDVRLFVRDIWRQWRDGQLSLPTAGETTDKAFMLIHIAFTDLRVEFPKLTTFDDVSEKLQLNIASTNGVSDDFSWDESHVRDSSSDTPADQLLCIPALSCLGVLRAWIAQIIRTTKCADKGDGIVGGAGSHLLAGHRLRRTIMLHFSELVQFKVRENLKKDFMNCDVFFRDLLSFLDNQRLALPFVVEFQIYMDIYDEVEMTGTRPYWLARYYADSIKDSYCNVTDVVEKLHGMCALIGPPGTRDVQEAILRVIKKAVETPVIRNPLAKIDSTEGDESDEAYLSFVLVNFPIMTGVLLSSLGKLKYLDGLDMCNDYDIVVATTLLYQACRTAGLFEKRWKDLEFVIAHQGMQQLGLRQTVTATPALAAAKHYGLAFGVELREYAKRAREMAKSGTSGIRRVPLPRESTSAFRKRAFVSISEPYLRTLTVTNVRRKGLGATLWETENSTIHQLAHDLLSEESQDIHQELRAQWRKCRRLTPVQLLGVFKSALVAGKPVVHFDYHGLYGQCAILLEAVQKGFLGMLERSHLWYGFAEVDENTELCNIVDEVLWKAAQEEMLPRRAMGRDVTLLNVSNSFAAVVDAGVGARRYEAALRYSSRTLAAPLKPCEHDAVDMAYLRNKPEHSANAKVSISGRDVQLTKPEFDSRWTDWRSQMDKVEDIVVAAGGDKLTMKVREELTKRVMKEQGVRRWWCTDGVDDSLSDG